jgi:hypothetical protein
VQNTEQSIDKLIRLKTTIFVLSNASENSAFTTEIFHSTALLLISK